VVRNAGSRGDPHEPDPDLASRSTSPGSAS
jgi:hypothetical protein